MAINNTIMYKEIKEQAGLINNCFVKNEQVLNQIVNLINNFNPSNIMLVGRGTSLHGAYYAKYLLELYYNLPVSICAPSIFTVYNKSLKVNNTLVIGISQSGGGEDICKVLEKCRSNGAMTLAITNNPDSIIAKAAEFNLYNEVGKAESYAATKTYTTTLYLITKLVYKLTGNQLLNISEEETIKAIDSAFMYEDIIKQSIVAFKDTKTAIILGRGYDLSLACEFALKLKETCHFTADAYPLSEFYHGPIVIANETTPTIVFATDSVTNNNAKKIIEDIKKLNTYTFAITNDVEVFNASQNGILINNTNNIYATFTAVAIMQLFSSDLSVIKGTNPDYNIILDKLCKTY